MIKTATSDDMTKVIDTLVLGFGVDPFVRWLFPESHEYLATFPKLIRLYGGGAFKHNTAYHNDDYTSAALWLPPSIHPDEEGLTALFEEKFSGSKLDLIFSMFEQMDKFHPDEPCYHLAFIAVDPAVYGKGYGTKMLKHTLALCDQDKKLACLESTNPANISIYKRHGFELIGSIEAEGAPSMFPMLRKPR